MKNSPTAAATAITPNAALTLASKLLRRHTSLSRILLPAALLFSLLVLLAPLYPAPHVLRRRAAHAASSTRYADFYDVPPTPRPAPADVCLVIGHDRATDEVWRFNSRSLCISSPLCLPASALARNRTTTMHTSEFARTTCRLVTPAFNNLPYVPPHAPHFTHHTPSCAAFHRRFAACPLVGPGMLMRYSCLAERAVTRAQLADVEADGALVLPGVTIVVPNYPYVANIYHFLNVATFVAEAAHHLPTLLAHYGAHKLRPRDALDRYPLTVLFMSPRTRLSWQASLLGALVRTAVARASPSGSVDVVYAAQVRNARVCAHNPVLLGRRGHVNVWPFANASAVPTDGSSVPAAAVRFRGDVYEALGVASPPLAHTLDAPASGRDAQARLVLPPRVLGYSRRPGRRAVVSGNVHKAGTVRRFGDDDERWMQEMLRNETARAGFELREFTIGGDESLEQQARQFAALGVLIGIHGANLVNAVFMRPLAALVEVFPAQVGSPCYTGGLNSGLAYWQHTATVMATPQESGCSEDEKRCWLLPRQRLVKIGTREDRDAIRGHVRDAIGHVNKLWKEHPEGVPVRYDEADGVYRRVR